VNYSLLIIRDSKVDGDGGEVDGDGGDGDGNRWRWFQGHFCPLKYGYNGGGAAELFKKFRPLI
jgi:hypothetical protein